MRHCLTWIVLAPLMVGNLRAADGVIKSGVGAVKSIDADTGTVVVTFGAVDYTLKADKDLRILDRKGARLADGLRSKELKPGTRVGVLYESNGLVLKALQLGAALLGKNPSRTSVGFKPLCDMTALDRYKGEDGGLYGGGKNEPPAEHQAAVRQETARIVPVDADGKPAKDGKVVLISIGYSNVTQLFADFKRAADADPQKSPALTIVDCARAGQAMAAWSRRDSINWTLADERLKNAGVARAQVQVAWMKMANARPKGEFGEHAKELKSDTVTVLHNLKARFPNLRIVYLGSRMYGGYSTLGINPEPSAYEGAFAVRWLIQDQIKKEPELNYDAARGAVKAPLILWGPYLWADGTTPRKSDGFTWQSDDFVGDGVHPAPGAKKKVTGILLNFFKTDVNAKTWCVK